MKQVSTKCSACGSPLQWDVAPPFDQAEVVGALCPACTDQQFVKQGGAVLAMRRELSATVGTIR